MIHGPYGTAIKLDIAPNMKNADTTVAWWLLTGCWHPVWPQFIITVVHLRPLPGLAAPHLHFPDATHELMVVALSPKLTGHWSVDEVAKKGLSIGYLEPIDVVHQFTATDAEMIELAELCAHGCVNAVLNPSTDDAREFYREQWLSSCVRTLAHMRGEQHAP